MISLSLFNAAENPKLTYNHTILKRNEMVKNDGKRYRKNYFGR
jgi:hypothetical protein